MSELISGKEALIALANGEEVLFRNKSTGDTNHAKYQTAECIQNGYYEYCGERIYLEFFIKPHTITINGVEVPCCGENYQYGDAMYILNSLEPEEYSLIVLDKADEVPAYWWRTEEEIKQVVAALRSIFSNK